ncbi:hypothetical protein [Sorangium atrum]|uniref:Uncharacterized protein n=1 Tax=Sorangium atrum TaxID=2995308 RepID=A0ABT5CEU3_9BACT|nr:hypothetical protein [Sorangium aterium]MDC0684960.1 hypothetical protein [Sorangium aterium]
MFGVIAPRMARPASAAYRIGGSPANGELAARRAAHLGGHHEGRLGTEREGAQLGGEPLVLPHRRVAQADVTYSQKR